ncbi:hypothetical protein OROGR_022755 [Orobanche gracilis]
MKLFSFFSIVSVLLLALLGGFPTASNALKTVCRMSVDGNCNEPRPRPIPVPVPVHSPPPPPRPPPPPPPPPPPVPKRLPVDPPCVTKSQRYPRPLCP